MNKKRGRKIQINFTNRWLYTFIAIGILAAVGIGVYAYGTSNPPVFGHSMGELAAPSGCVSNQVLQWSGTSWTCVTLPSQAQWPYLQSIKLTSASHNGNFSGYDGMYNWIQANGCSGYHVCTADEVTSAIETGLLAVAIMPNHAWYNTGVSSTYPTGTDSSVIVNDCIGWKYPGASGMGTVFTNYSAYKPSAPYSGVVYCSYSYPVLCCK